MKEYEASNIRTLALIGHGSAGKTILAESMLACSGAITRIGSVEQGSTVSDYHEDEQQRQISIHTTSMYAEWKSCKLNILDSPGRIQDVQLTGLPFGIHRGGVNRDLPLLFIFMIIRNRTSLFDASDSGDCPAAGKHRFGKDGFARRSMTDEGQGADV